jgi:hypothetical protein
MLGNAAPEETVTPETGPDWDLPGFMQESGRQSIAAAQDSVNLISANDLPDWIRQIAEADAAKAEAEEMERAAKAPVASEAPASLVPKSLPGETRGSASSATTWLSKSSAAQESGDAWATEEAAAASWGNAPVAPPAHVAPPSYPTITPHTAYIPTTPSSTPESGKRGRFSLSSSPDSFDKPLYRSRPVQLAFLAVLLVVLLAFVL